MDRKNEQSEVLHYDNPDFPVFIRKNFIERPDELEDAFIHWHDEVELIYVLSGDIRYLINGERIVLRAGEGVFVNSRQLHRILGGTKECELLCLIFSPMLLCTSKYVTGKFVQPVLSAENLPYIFLKSDVEWQKNILQKVDAIYQSTIHGEEELEVMAHLYHMWHFVFSNVKGQEQKTNTQNDLLYVKIMIEYIQGAYEERITLRDICESGSMGKNKCTSLFWKYTNMSPVDYVRHYRVEKSIELLKYSHMTITEIAYATGFSGASYFAETFRKYVGCSPVQYREKYKMIAGGT